MMPRRFHVASTLVWALLALSAATRVSVAQRPAIQRAGNMANDESDPTIRLEIDRARARGIPAEPLLSKVREGRLKRAPVPRIRSAVAALAVRLDSARAVIGPDATIEELTASADALAAGANANDLRMVASATAARPLSAPLGALAQLVASGVPSRRAAEMIVELLHRKPTGAMVLAFGNLVEADAASGMPAEEAAMFRLHSLGTAAGSAATSNLPASIETLNSTVRPRPTTSAPRRRP
jgi:hypothetical protein